MMIDLFDSGAGAPDAFDKRSDSAHAFSISICKVLMPDEWPEKGVARSFVRQKQKERKKTHTNTHTASQPKVRC